jgi:hypothetical protein
MILLFPPPKGLRLQVYETHWTQRRVFMVSMSSFGGEWESGRQEKAREKFGF